MSSFPLCLLQNSECVKDGLLSLASNLTSDLLLSMSIDELQGISFECDVLLGGDKTLLKKAEVHGISSLKARMDKVIRRVENERENQAKTARLADLQAECFMRVCFLSIRLWSACHSDSWARCRLAPRLTSCRLACGNLVLTGNQGAEL